MVCNCMPYCDLQPGFIKPDRIFISINLKTFSPFAVFTLHKLRIFLRCLFTHEIIDDPELACFPVSSCP